MKLKKLEIVGFKSFCDKASIQFTSGISAVVGPNGCGKSNIVDAIRWVMGEQSVKQLRGKNMEDVIFAGTKGNAATNMAEVSVVLLNDNGSSPEEYKDYSEIMVTRRLYRSGESAYLINRRPCRLKDIQNIFMGSGMGPRTYAIIQQGNIGAITDAGPLERRVFIEEASGVTRYKVRRTEALRKVDATHQNILRVNDIISEVNRQMNNLDRQAQKAKRYKQYQDQIKSIDISLLIKKNDDLTAKIKENGNLLEALKDADINQDTQIKKIDAAIEDIKVQRTEKNHAISVFKTEKHEIERKTDRMEADLSHFKKDVERLTNENRELSQAFDEITEKNSNILSEINEVDQKKTTMEIDIEHIKASLEKEKNDSNTLREHLTLINKQAEISKKSLMNLIAEEAKIKNIFQTESSNKETLKRRLKRIDEEKLIGERKVRDLNNAIIEAKDNKKLIEQSILELTEKIEVIKKSLGKGHKQLQKEIKVGQRLEFAHNKIKSNLTNLKRMENNLDWYKDGVKAILQSQNSDSSIPTSEPPPSFNVIGMMADIIEPESGFEAAVEASLGEVLQYIMVENQLSCLEGIDYLKKTTSGRSGFIPVSSIKNAAPLNHDATMNPNAILNHIRIKAGFEPIVNQLLKNVVIAKDMDEALSLYNHNGHKIQTIVTIEGDIVDQSGVMIGGYEDSASGILSKKQEIKKLNDVLKKLNAKSEARSLIRKEIEIKVRMIERELQETIEEKNDEAKEAIDSEKHLYKIEEELKHASRHLEIVTLEQEQLLGEESDIVSRIEEHHHLLTEISNNVEKTQDEVARISVDSEDTTSNLEHFNQRIVDFKLKITAMNAEIENNTHTLRRLKEFRQDSGNRLEQITKDKQLKQEKKEQIKEKIENFEKNLSIQYDKINEIDIRLQASENEYHHINSQLKESDKAISQIQNEREKTLQKIRLIELELSEKKIKLENIEIRSREKYHHAISELRAQMDDIENNPRLSVPEMENKLKTLKERLANIGNVNLGAIEEFQKLKERYDFLSQQRDDLLKAIDDLHKVIKKINQITQERFITTFNQVNEKLQILFPRLFEGGKAQLELTDPNNPLETGIEYMVHPPGKKLTRMSLLSGGEKALSAISFIFAIFMIKPTSFCLMDEIDAPLDDANVGRFNELLKVIGIKSQIIMITHNKKSMEFADTLFGVTMEKRGISKIVSVNFENKN